jgi:hypothetical protein
MRNRNRILTHNGIGKGDKSRVSNEKEYQANLAEISFSGIPASQDTNFEQRGGKSVRVYGVRAVVPDVKLSSKPIIH